MKTLNRRAFGKTLLTLSALPAVRDSLLQTRLTSAHSASTKLPERVAGYMMTEEERRLAAKFLENHETNMAALRERELPNSLAPNFIFTSPVIKGKNGEDRR